MPVAGPKEGGSDPLPSLGRKSVPCKCLWGGVPAIGVEDEGGPTAGFLDVRKGEGYMG